GMYVHNQVVNVLAMLGRKERQVQELFFTQVIKSVCHRSNLAGWFGGIIGSGHRRGPSRQINEKRPDASQDKDHHDQQTQNSKVHSSGKIGVGLAKTSGTGQQRLRQRRHQGGYKFKAAASAAPPSRGVLCPPERGAPAPRDSECAITAQSWSSALRWETRRRPCPVALER